MFPTKSKSNIQLQMNGKLHLENGSSICLNSYQHIYITYNEEIKEGDWFLTNQNGHWELQKCQKICDDGIIMSFEEEIAMYQENTYFVFKPKSCKKIIATTDTSLKTHHFNKGVFKDLEYSLPQLSQEFIEAYVKAYNEGHPITEVEVEYVKIPNSVFISEIDAPYIQPKVNSNNTININFIKDSWNKEEVKQLCKLAFKYHCDNSRTTSLPDKWFEENI